MSHNSSQGFDRPLQVELRTSRWLLGGGVLLLAATLLSCLWMPVPLAWRGGLCAMLCLHAVCVYRLHISATAPQAIRALAWDRRRGWRIAGPGGEWHRARLRLPVFVAHRMAVARFRVGNRRRTVILVGDRADAGDFRRIRVRLIQSAHGDRDRAEISGKG